MSQMSLVSVVSSLPAFCSFEFNNGWLAADSSPRRSPWPNRGEDVGVEFVVALADLRAVSDIGESKSVS